MEELISIVVPVYNVASYLEQCLDSILAQSFMNFEVIMVNDGSTDKSGEICKEYTKKDQRFQVINQENQGLSGARNTGLAHIHGEYVCFVDSDDCLHPDYLKILYENLKQNNADISMCNYQEFCDDLPIVELKNESSVLSQKQVMLNLATAGAGNKSQKMVVAWNKLIKSDIMNGLSYRNTIHEDEFMILDLILKTTSIVWTNDELYWYRQRPNSIMDKKDIRHLVLLDAIKERMDFYEHSEFKDVLLPSLAAFFDNAVIWDMALHSQNKFWRIRVYLGIMKRYIPVYLKYKKIMNSEMRKQYGLFIKSPKKYRDLFWK